MSCDEPAGVAALVSNRAHVSSRMSGHLASSQKQAQRDERTEGDPLGPSAPQPVFHGTQMCRVPYMKVYRVSC